MIKFKEVTWYSRLAAIVLFIGLVPVLAFCIGVQYEKTVTSFSQNYLEPTPPSLPKPAYDDFKRTYTTDDVDFALINTFTLADINFDGHVDLQERISIGGTNRHESYRYYVYNPETKVYEFSQAFTDIDGVPNEKTQEIYAGYISGCAGACTDEQIYKIKDNTPYLIEEVTRYFDDDTKTLIEEVKKLVNGVYVTSTSTVIEE